MKMKSISAHGKPGEQKPSPQIKIYSFFNRQLTQAEIAPTSSKQTTGPNSNRQLLAAFFSDQFAASRKWNPPDAPR
jgi:hypothetical protein